METLDKTPAALADTEPIIPGQLDLTSEAGWKGSTPDASTPNHPGLEVDVGTEQDGINPADSMVEITPDIDDEPTETLAKLDLEKLTPEDRKRLESRAKEFFNRFENPQEVSTMHAVVAEHAKLSGNDTAKLFKELSPDSSDAAVEAMRDQAAGDAKAKKVAEMVETYLPYGGANWRQRRRINANRRSLSQLLEMPQEEFANLVRDWQLHEMSRFDIGQEREKARQEAQYFDLKYGGVMAEISAMPLDRQDGGAVDSALETLMERRKQISGGAGLADTELIDGAITGEALKAIEASLIESYRLQGMGENEIQFNLSKNRGALTTWLEHVDYAGQPLSDLDDYEKHIKWEQILAGRHKQAVRFIFMRTLSPPKFESAGMESTESGENLPAINLEREFSSLLVRNRRRSDLAKELARNQSRLVRGLIVASLVARFGGDAAHTMWESIPKEKLNKVRRRALVSSMAIARRYARGVKDNLNKEVAPAI